MVRSGAERSGLWVSALLRDGRLLMHSQFAHRLSFVPALLGPVCALTNTARTVWWITFSASLANVC